MHDEPWDCIEHQSQNSAGIHPCLMMHNLYIEAAKAIPFSQKIQKSDTQKHSTSTLTHVLFLSAHWQSATGYFLKSKRYVSCQDLFI